MEAVTDPVETGRDIIIMLRVGGENGENVEILESPGMPYQPGLTPGKIRTSPTRHFATLSNNFCQSLLPLGIENSSDLQAGIWFCS